MVESLTEQMLADFIRTFGASLDPRVWITFVQEEEQEVLDAIDSGDKENLLKEVTDLIYVQIGFNMVAVGAEQQGLFSSEEHAELMTAITKAQAVHEKGVEILGEDVNYFEAFRRVHLSNMSKLGEDGKPIRREDGKILKGPNYVEPKLGDLL